MLRRLVTSKVRQRWAEQQQQQQQQQQHCYYRPPLVEEETEAITAGYCSLDKIYAFCSSNFDKKIDLDTETNSLGAITIYTLISSAIFLLFQFTTEFKTILLGTAIGWLCNFLLLQRQTSHP